MPSQHPTNDPRSLDDNSEEKKKNANTFLVLVVDPQHVLLEIREALWFPYRFTFTDKTWSRARCLKGKTTLDLTKIVALLLLLMTEATYSPSFSTRDSQLGRAGFVYCSLIEISGSFSSCYTDIIYLASSWVSTLKEFSFLQDWLYVTCASENPLKQNEGKDYKWK